MLTALLLSISLAAPGDIEALLSTLQVETSPEQKQKLGDALVGVFPNAVKATVRNFNCRREDNDLGKGIGCDGWYKDRQSIATMVTLQIEGDAGTALDEGAPEGFADFYHLVDFKLADVAALILLDTFVKATFIGLELADMYDFRCARDSKENTKIVCAGVYRDVVGEATYHTLNKARHVLKPLRKMP